MICLVTPSTLLKWAPVRGVTAFSSRARISALRSSCVTSLAPPFLLAKDFAVLYDTGVYTPVTTLRSETYAHDNERPALRRSTHLTRHFDSPGLQRLAPSGHPSV